MDDGRDVFAGFAALILAVFAVVGVVIVLTGIFYAVAWFLSIWYIWGSVIVLGAIGWAAWSNRGWLRNKAWRRRRFTDTTRKIDALFTEGENEMWRIKQEHDSREFDRRHRKYLEGS